MYLWIFLWMVCWVGVSFVVYIIILAATAGTRHQCHRDNPECHECINRNKWE